jgi:hypothetical protein
MDGAGRVVAATLGCPAAELGGEEEAVELGGEEEVAAELEARRRRRSSRGRRGGGRARGRGGGGGRARGEEEACETERRVVLQFRANTEVLTSELGKG